MILGTAGHIDHGKTALVRALTGVDTDRLPEEKRRGITIDLGFAPLVIDGVGTIGIVDVPGHEAFIRTMLAGASGIDFALLVIAADEGIMPQTEEHLEILKILGVERGIVALTKCDLVDKEWLDLQTAEVTTLVTGLASNPSWPVIPVSAKTGSGIDKLKDWIGRFAQRVSRRSADSDLFRMPIDRAFTVKGTGTVVTGTVWSGSITRDTSLVVQPSGKPVRVRGIEHHGAAADTASAGQRTAIALAGTDLGEVERGSVLVSEPEWTGSTDITAIFEFNRDELKITSRTRVLFHLGTSEVEARFPDGTVSLPAREAQKGRIRLKDPVVLRNGDRFVLRMPSPARTIGGGIVLEPYPVQTSKRTALELINGKRPKSVDSRVGSLLWSAGLAGLSIRVLPVITGLTPKQVSEELTRIDSIELGARQYAREAGEILMNRIESIVSEGVANHPIEPGVSLQSTRAAADAPGGLVDWAISGLVDSGRIEVVQSLVRPAGWKPKLGEAEDALSNSIMHDICKQPSEPPSLGELESKFGGKTRALIRKLERDGALERVSDDRYYSSEAVAIIIEEMRARLVVGRVYTPAELREVLGVSRKYLIPFLEFCDREGVTERRQEGRAVRPPRETAGLTT
ncbi:MAG TPA: selenocysteine-specific translation elongation factor [Gemmatimonadaceae bacterium]|nr:selenocysteine-specific translation elongation factor [Gemmatimonadaceae bacterium]